MKTSELTKIAEAVLESASQNACDMQGEGRLPMENGVVKSHCLQNFDSYACENYDFNELSKADKAKVEKLYLKLC